MYHYLIPLLLLIITSTIEQRICCKLLCTQASRVAKMRNTFCRTELKYFHNAESKYRSLKNNALSETYLIIWEISYVKNG